MSEEKKRVLSGIQPTGIFTLGNYIGAVKNWEQMQKDFECIYFIADLHALTVAIEPAKLRSQTYDCVALLLACGVDPENSILFVQSHVPEHTQLSWILSCSTQFGELSRMTQFKDKSARHADNVNAGLFTYPVLMAADILAYNCDLVPVGADQKQHLELARNVAQRFNSKYGELLKVPEPYIPKVGARIMSLADPTIKMSKSDPNPNGCIYILDDHDTIIRKFKRAVTDSDTQVKFAEGKDGINNLMSIYSIFTGKSIEEIEKEFEGKGYGEFKLAVGEAVSEGLRPIRENFQKFRSDKAYLEEVMKNGAMRAGKISSKIVSKAYRKVGLADRVR